MKTKLMILVLVILLSGGVIMYRSQQQAEQVYTQEQENAAMELLHDRQELERELADVKEQLLTVYQGAGSYTLLIESPTEALREALPALRERKLGAVIALSPERYPGAEGCITAEEFAALTAQGWSTCLAWDGQQALSELKRQAEPLFAALGQPMPTALYVQSGGYYHYKNADILNAGFETVLHHGEVDELIARKPGGEPFLLGAVPWNDPQIRTTLSELGEYGGALVLTMDFTSQYGQFKADSFDRMANYLAGESLHLIAADLSGAKENVESSYQGSYLHQRRDWLLSEIDRLDGIIEQVYSTTAEELTQSTK